ncbi:class 1b ribonucleoside-diphosphate reductase subunit alpha [Corynebacterium sp.]|uniref:class 1b ribonucleoside-diphosphate reductase subunit alpha n=1 Tax=Corynebacterium sp. TaxID=1720 RepID=UPI0028B16F5A|nr:class 1b ribonucleoside-diphosphate reductase subunit alpha [Corynebacterium sp.]
MTDTSYYDLNAEVNILKDGKLQLEKDREAARAYHLQHVNKHTRFFHSLREKTDYLLDNNLWKHETVETFTFDQFKELFKQAYAHKFRFQSFIGAYKFYQSYALRDLDGTTIIERFEDRVVMTAIDLSGGDYQQARDLVDIITLGLFQPATPTFLNAGRAQAGERVSCFLLRVEDNMESIGRMVNSALQLSKRGGGVGINLTNIRELGAPIKAIPNAASGLVPVMKVLEDSFKYANQLGQRQGAGAVYVNAHHPDIMRVLDTKRENADESVRIKTLSIGVIIPDVTFDLAKRNADMYLFSPYDVEKVEGRPFSECSVTEHYDAWVEDDRITKTKVNARKFFQTLSELQFESGYPYVLFEDTANREHPMKHVSRVQMSNLCSEILQLQTASEYNDDLTYSTIGHDISCNLGSLNVHKMLELSQEEFIDTVIVAVRALDQVSRSTSIDSVPSVRRGNDDSHSIGLGQMNLHGALAARGIEYGSPEALYLWGRYMPLVTLGSMIASARIAEKYGEHRFFQGSEYQTGEWFRRVPHAWLNEVGENDLTIPGTKLHAPTRQDWRDLEVMVSQYGMANAYLQAIPPTGSISYINHSTSSIHPVASGVEIRKEGKLGRVYYPAPHLTNENAHLFQSASTIGYEKIIDTYAVSQRWVDQGQSLTLFFNDKVTTRDLDRARIYAFRKGIKTLYYIRIQQAAMDGTRVEGTAAGFCESCAL